MDKRSEFDTSGDEVIIVADSEVDEQVDAILKGEIMVDISKTPKIRIWTYWGEFGFTVFPQMLMLILNDS